MLDMLSQEKVLSESFTSKTCTQYGILNEKLKGSKIFECNNCDLSLDRDVNGARNIFLKHHQLKWCKTCS